MVRLGRIHVLACLLLSLAASGLHGGEALVMVSAASTGPVAPGGRATVAVTFAIAPDWHLYWTNPGDSGLAPTLRFTLPAGWSAAPPRFPVPHRLEEAGLVSFAYTGSLRLLVDLAVPAEAPPGDQPIAIAVEYLVCKESCIPGKATVPVVQAVAPGAVPAAPDLTGFAVAPEQAGLRALAQSDAGAVVLELAATGLPAPPGFPFLPADEGTFSLGATQVASAGPAGWRLRIPLAAGERAPDRLRGLVVGVPGVAGVAIDLPIRPSAGVAASTASVEAAGVGLGWALLAGLAGGLLLNLMPCVLPVLALKVLSVNRARAAGRPLLGPALGYAAGILATYLLLAGILLILRSAGVQVGWGFQLQQPAVVLALAALFVLLAANLAGLFEIGLAATRLDAGRGGPFLNGVLTTIVATPCGAPFASAALAFAAVAPVGEALAVFAALGVGLAAPVVALAAIPGAAAWLPRPGAWMEDLKHVLAVPMLAAAGWMAWTFTALAGSESAFAVLVVALPLLALAAGAYGRFQQDRSRIAGALALIALLGAAGTAAWAVRQSAAAQSAEAPAHGWERWTPDRERELLAAGTPLLVDFTAAWCLTCQVNKRTTLHDEGVLRALAARGVALLRADFTARDAAVAAALARHGRASVPTYVLHPGGGRDAVVLPDLLTPGIITDAITAIPRKTP